MAEDVLPTASASTPVRVRARLARLTSQRQQIDPAVEPLFRIVHATHPKADFGVIERAYRAAARAHTGQKRKSGDPYITHPLAVATILAELGMTPPTLAAALLHDTVEDTDYMLSDLPRRVRRRGGQARRRCDQAGQGQVRPGGPGRDRSQDGRGHGQGHPGPGHQARRPAAQHARTWRYVSKDSARRKARETLEIYAPLAHRLGMNTIKWELEDLSFGTLHPKVLRRDRPLGCGAGTVPRRTVGRGDRLGTGRPTRRQAQGVGHRAAQALLLDLPEDDRSGPRLR